MPIGPSLASTGAVDFDDLVVGAADALESDPRLRLRWQGRFTHLCVDEFQDVDAAQLRLVRLLAEPQRNLFVVGDDDQTIYAWRLADVRRILSFEALYPGTRRVQLATNYRCPAPVVAISRRLIGINRGALRQAHRPVPGRRRPIRTRSWPTPRRTPDGPMAWSAWRQPRPRRERTVCFLARTRSELGPMLLALARAGVPHTTTVPAAVQADPVQRAGRPRHVRLPGHAPPFEALLRPARGPRLAPRRCQRRALATTTTPRSTRCWAGPSGIARLDRFLEAHDRAVARLEALRRPGRADRAGHGAWRQGPGVADRRRARHGGGSVPEPARAGGRRPTRTVRSRRSGDWPTWH